MAYQNLGRVGLVPKGTWNSTVDYVPLDLVAYDGNAWAAKRNNKNVTPNTTNSDDWQLISNNADLVSTVQGLKNAAAASASDAADSAAAAAASAQKGQNALDAIATQEANTTSSRAYSSGEHFFLGGVLYEATADIAQGGTIVTSGTGKNCKTAVLGAEVSDLKSALDYPYGALPTNTDVDAIDTNGVWWVSIANTYTHLPSGMTNGVLINRLTHTTATNIRLQIAYSNDDLHLYHRYRVTSGWTVWQKDALGSDVAAIKSALDSDVAAIKSAMSTVDDIDLIAGGNRVNAENNSVSFTWNTAKTACTVNGTNSSSSAYAANTILGSSTTIPNGIEPGKSYLVSVTSTSNDLRLGFYAYANGEYLSTTSFYENGVLNVPASATGLIVFIGLRPRKTADNDVISGIALQKNNFDNVLSNIDGLKSALDYPYGALENNTDVDTIDTNGVWWVSIANTYTHLPSGMTNGVLINRLTHTTATNIRLQIAYSNNDLHLYHRYRVTNGWGDWQKDALASEIDAIAPYGTIRTQTSTSRTMTVAKSIAQGDRLSVNITNWTGPTPSAINLYLTADGTTYTLKVTAYKIGQWLDFIADQAYTGYRVGMKTASALSEAATLEFIETPNHQPEYITEPIPGAPVVYGKKILLGGASIVAGYGGTGYAMDGDVIIDISGTQEGQAYSTGGLWKRNTSGYCWANLFKTLCEGQYDATVVNNGCAGVDISFWARHAETLIPDDGFDLMIYSFSSNDRNAAPETVKTKIKNGLKTLLDRCQELGIELIVFSVPPASQTNEEGKQTQTWQCNEFIKSACADLSIQYFDLHDALIKYYWDHGAASAGTYISDGLHPNDSMYYVMYFQYLWLLDVSPMTAYAQPPATT